MRWIWEKVEAGYMRACACEHVYAYEDVFSLV